MKKVLKLLTFLLLLIVAVEARAEEWPIYVETTYIDGYGVENTVEAIPLTGYETSLGTENVETWYVANSSFSFDHTITLNGNVNLILADGIEMTVDGGEEAAGFNIENNSFFVVFSQSLGDNMGQLTVSGHPGIQQGGIGVIFFGGKVSVSGIVNSLDNAQVVISGGQISVNNIDGGTVIIGHNSPNDKVKFSASNCTVRTDWGKCFVSDEGKLISGNDISEELYSGHELIPCYTFSLPEDFEITNDVKLIEGKYVAACTEIQFELKSGSTIDGEVRMNGEVITADGNGVYTAKATADLVIDVTKSTSVEYIDENGEPRTTDAIILTETTGIYSGWYVVNEDITFDHTLNFFGDVHIILANGKTMTVTSVEDSDGLFGSANSTLSIYGQPVQAEEQPGTLTIKDCWAGISGEASNANININGGNVDIQCKMAALWGNQGNSIVINGGEVSLESQEYHTIAAHICTINGGKVKATTKANDYHAISARKITLGCTKIGDYIEASSYSGNVSIAEGQTLTDGEGNTYSGEIEQVSDLAGKKLHGAIAVAYIDEQGNKAYKEYGEYTILTGSETSLEAGWYVAASTITFDHQINVKGDVNLILADGATMTVNTNNTNQSGIGVNEHQFAIYGQGLQSGTLEVKNCRDGIHGYGDFILYGGKVLMTDGINGDGIFSESSITINRGTVNIQSQYASLSSWENIKINGGKVKATTKNGDRAIYADGIITLGCTNIGDYIEASSYDGIVSITDGQILTDGEGNTYSGDLEEDQVKALAGKQLFNDDGLVEFSLPGCMEITNGVTLLGGKYVVPGTEVEFDFKSGFALDGGVQMNGEDIQKDGDVYSVTATEDITITATASVAYVDENGNDAYKESGEYTILTGSETFLGAGWYVAASPITFAHTITLNGDVNLILADDATMTVNPNNEDEDGIYADEYHFAIYGQKFQSGILEIKNCNDGIFSEYSDFILYGGNISMPEGIKNIGIQCLNAITINRGTVNIQSQKLSLSSWGDIKINGGEVILISQEYSAIRTDNNCSINGGKVKATTKSEYDPAISAYNITLGCTNSNDYIEVSSYYQAYNLSIAEGQVLTDGKGNLYSGKLTGTQIATLANSHLNLAFNHSVVIPDCMEIVKYVAEESKIIIAFRFGSELKSAVTLDDGTPLTSEDGVYSVIVNQDIEIKAETNIEISTVDELRALSDAVNKGYDFSGMTVTLTKDIEFETSETEDNNFTAIGWYDGESVDLYFNGTFDGDGHTISGIRINQSESENQGLFGQIGNDAVIENLVLANIEITGYDYVGGIAGFNMGGKIKNCLELNAQIFAATEDDNPIFMGADYHYNLSYGNDAIANNIYKLTLANGIIALPQEDNGVFKSGDEYYCVEGSRIDLLSAPNPLYENVDFVATVDGIIDGENTLTMPNEDVKVSAVATVTVPYIDIVEGKEVKETTTATVLTGSETSLGAGWYVATSTITFDHTITLNGNVNLILADGATMTVNPKGSEGIIFGSNYQFAIYGQEHQSGTLVIKNCSYGIRGLGYSCVFILYGGNILMPEGIGEHGIFCESITINRGTVDIQSQRPSLTSLNIEINGGVVNLESQESRAIGASNNCMINGGKVKATAKDNNYPAISSGGNITLGCTKSDDYIEASSYKGSVSIADGQVLADEKGNYYSGTLTTGQIEALANTTLTRATLAITKAPEAIEKLTYSGGEQALVSAGESNYGKVLYSLSEDGEYTEAIPTGKDAKTYTVYYKAQAGEEATEVASVEVVIGDKVTDNGALKIIENQSGKTAILDGAYTGADPVEITDDIEVDKVTFSRAFTNGATSTIILPFEITAGNYSGGTFYKLNSIYADNGDWKADVNKVMDVMAHTPYIFVPNGDEFTITGSVTLQPTVNANTKVSDGNWTFTGVYARKRWGADAGDNKDYCFAANETDDGIHIGDFVKIGTYVQLKPFRCYLTYDDGGISKATPILPESIKVRIVDVIDEPSDVVDEHNDDFETPVSEIVPAANVKVWSYDKTIYISAAAGTDYRIIDANGRALASGITATDRDEIRLGNRSGIVIVIINGKSFKVNY